MRVILVGGHMSGRLSLASTYANGHYTPNDRDYLAPVFHEKRFGLDGEGVYMEILCPCGTERFRCLTPQYVRNVDGVFFCFPVSNRRLFEELREIHEELRDCIAIDAHIMVLGTMKDAEREVSYEEGKEFADSISAPYCEVSAATGENVSNVFLRMARGILKKEPTLNVIETTDDPTKALIGCKT